MKRRGGRKERRKFAREESRDEWRDWKGADKDIKRLKRTRKREREVVRQRWRSSKIRKREKVEFGLKIERGISKMYIVDKR